MALLRRELGAALRLRRTGQHRSLRDVAAVAGVSLGYLSEVERGVKEASSELLVAICRALAVPLPDLLVEVAYRLSAAEPAGRGSVGSAAPVLTVAADPQAAETEAAGAVAGGSTRVAA